MASILESSKLDGILHNSPKVLFVDETFSHYYITAHTGKMVEQASRFQASQTESLVSFTTMILFIAHSILYNSVALE